jgi:hypothetical protein
VLVAIAQHGRLVAAAEWLKVSPSALNRTVTRVEKLLGVTLFVRSTRRVEPICVILPRAHPLARSANPIRLAQLRNVPLVSLSRESYNRRLFEGAAATAGVSLRHAVLVLGFLEMISQVRAGVGVGVLPAGALPKSPDRDFVVRTLIAPSLSVAVSLLRLNGRHMSPAASSFMALVLTHLTSERQTQTGAWPIGIARAGTGPPEGGHTYVETSGRSSRTNGPPKGGHYVRRPCAVVSSYVVSGFSRTSHRQPVTPTFSDLALASIISTTCRLGGGSLSRMVGRGPLTLT